MSDPPADHIPTPRVTYGTYQVRCSCGYETPVFSKIKGMDGQEQDRPKTQSEAWKMFREHWTEATGAPPPQKKPRNKRVVQSEKLFD